MDDPRGGKVVACVETPEANPLSYLTQRCQRLTWLTPALGYYAGVLERSRRWGVERGIYPGIGDDDNLHFRYEKALSCAPDGCVVLDMGCGSGYGSAIMARKASHVYGVDVSPEALAYARLRYAQENVSFLLQDVRNLLFRDGTFDVITQIENLEHIDLPEMCVQEAQRLLKPGGLYVVTVPYEEISPESPFHLTHFSRERLRFLLESHFELLELRETPHLKYLAVARKRNERISGVDDDWLRANDGLRMDAFRAHCEFSRRLFHLDRYAFAAERLRGMRVLAVACGTGCGARLMRLRGVQSITGVDNDPLAVDYARRHHAVDTNTFQVADASSLPAFPATLDAAVCFETIEYVANDKVLLEGLRRSVKAGGHVILSIMNNWPATEHHVRSYDLQSLTALLGTCFSVEAVFNQNSGTPWEPNHGQPRGIVPTTPANQAAAECFLVVLRVPRVGA